MTVISQEGYDTHVREALKLDADGYANLISIRLRAYQGEPETTLYITPQKEITWQGILWENWPCGITGSKQDSSEEVSRPKFSVTNPEGVFSRFVHAGMTDNAEITRYRVLGQHLDSDTNSYLKNIWRISRVVTLTKTLVAFELRGALDGHFFKLPARQYLPPEFSQVSL